MQARGGVIYTGSVDRGTDITEHVSEYDTSALPARYLRNRFKYRFNVAHLEREYRGKFYGSLAHWYTESDDRSTEVSEHGAK